MKESLHGRADHRPPAGSGGRRRGPSALSTPRDDRDDLLSVAVTLVECPSRLRYVPRHGHSRCIRSSTQPFCRVGPNLAKFLLSKPHLPERKRSEQYRSFGSAK